MQAAHSRFQDLLLRYSQEADPRRRERIERQLWDDYGTTQAVLVADMSGFSKLTDRYGIVHYLSMVRRMQLTAEPIVRSFGGVLLKFEADNCFAMFEASHEAVRAAIALQLAFAAANRLTPDELDIRLGCGIDRGPILVIEERDFFGDAVNRASKLGEDLAQPGEILVTRQALEEQRIDPDWLLASVSFDISGLQIEAWRVELRAEAAG